MAESQFYAILTDQGAALEATALATGIPVTLDKFVIGDGGGNAVTPDPTRTTLVNEVYRGTIQKAESQDNQVTFTLYVPPEAGGYTIREAGILTADGTLYSLSNSPDILKPTESNGAVISITFKYILAVSSTSTVNIVVYDDYLTPEAADEKYLQISKNLSEIKDKGEDAQKTTRGNIGITGDIAYRDEYNFFSENARWGDGVNTSVMLRIIRYRLTDVGYLQGVATTWLKLHSVGGIQLSVADVNSLICRVGSNNYQVYHEGNLTPVLSVNNSKPDASGNVKVQTSTSTGLSGVRLGSVAAMDYSVDKIYDCPTGCVMTGILSGGGDGRGSFHYKPIQAQSSSGSWVTIDG
ncbi:phage tail protein [Salmonella enterica subsp. enterica]|nr:phage tail protein [Salmonella enterica subsp. enterica]EHS8060027.1 phage tail protein [Salmonella enterica subsp. enterica]